jgi:hypothetical protein
MPGTALGAIASGIKYTRIYTNIILGGFSMFALLTLTLERFLALIYIYFSMKPQSRFSGIFDDHNSQFAAINIFLREHS